MELTEGDMLLTTKQACERLGVGRAKLFKLIKAGQIAELGETKPGGHRHQLKFGSKEIEAYRKQARNGSNGHHQAVVERPRVVEPSPEVESSRVVIRRPDVVVAPIRHRLDSIERKLQSLETTLLEVVRLWS